MNICESFIPMLCLQQQNGEQIIQVFAIDGTVTQAGSEVITRVSVYDAMGCHFVLEYSLSNNVLWAEWDKLKTIFGT